MSSQAGRTIRKGVLVQRWRIGLSARTAARGGAGSDRGETARIDPPKSLRSTMLTPTPSARSKSSAGVGARVDTAGQDASQPPRLHRVDTHGAAGEQHDNLLAHRDRVPGSSHVEVLPQRVDEPVRFLKPTGAHWVAQVLDTGHLHATPDVDALLGSVNRLSLVCHRGSSARRSPVISGDPAGACGWCDQCDPCDEARAKSWQDSIGSPWRDGGRDVGGRVERPTGRVPAAPAAIGEQPPCARRRDAGRRGVAWRHRDASGPGWSSWVTGRGRDAGTLLGPHPRPAGRGQDPR